ncbi:MAG: transporter substrate-binding domain-containing protein [Eubacteriales bacterium]|nr:transporter substrate-binding domain-containing protein [Eubacteriales bacterium]
MTKKFACFILLVLAVLLCTAALAEDDQAQTVRVGFYPILGFQNVDENGELSGYMYDYYQEIAKYTGWQYEFYTGSFSDCLEKITKGELDLMGGIQKTPEREEQFEFPMYDCAEICVSLYVSSSNDQYIYGDAEHFDGMVVGVLENMAMQQDLLAYCERNGITMKIQTYDREEEMLQALFSGEIEAVCSFSASRYANVRCIAAFAYKDCYIMGARGSGDFIVQLEKALEDIKLYQPNYELELWQRYFSAVPGDTPMLTREELDYIQNAGPITVVYNRDWKPLEYSDPDTGEYCGVSARLFGLLSELTGLTFQYIPADNYMAIYDELSRGDVSIISSTAYDGNWSAEHNLQMTQPFITCPIVMISSVDESTEIQTIAMPQEHYVTRLVRERFPEYTFEEYPTVTACLKAMLDGKADATFINELMAREILLDSHYSAFTVVTLNNVTVDYCVGVDEREKPLLRSVLDKALACVTGEQISEFLIAQTVSYRKTSLLDLFNQNPLQYALLIGGSVLLILALLLVMLIGKMRYAENVSRMLNVDALTGAPSLYCFQSRALRRLSSPRTRDYALLYMNLSRFKDVNSMYGYAVGDEVLRFLSNEIKAALMENEGYTRVYADRFAVVLQYDGSSALQQRFEELNRRFSGFAGENRAFISCIW